MDINEQRKATSLQQSVQQQLRMLCDASDKCLRMQADDHLNHSQQADCDVKTRRADLQLPSVELTPKSTRTYYDLLKLQRRPYTVIDITQLNYTQQCYYNTTGTCSTRTTLSAKPHFPGRAVTASEKLKQHV